MFNGFDFTKLLDFGFDPFFADSTMEKDPNLDSKKDSKEDSKSRRFHWAERQCSHRKCQMVYVQLSRLLYIFLKEIERS